MENWNNMSVDPLNNMMMNRNRNNNNFSFNNFNAPHYEVIRVNGEAGAMNFRMAPNSNTLLLDNTASVVWFVQTDGAGYLTATPYDLVPHAQPQQIDINNLAQRVAQLEETINANKSYSSTNRQSKKQRQHDESATESASIATT